MIVVLAEQGMNGMSKDVIIRSLRDSRVRVEKMAGTLQPKPRINGDTDFPCSPMRCMKVSSRKPARAR